MKVSTHYHDQLLSFLSISCVFPLYQKNSLLLEYFSASSPFLLKYSCCKALAASVDDCFYLVVYDRSSSKLQSFKIYLLTAPGDLISPHTLVLFPGIFNLI